MTNKKNSKKSENEDSLIHRLVSFGLTHAEAGIYMYLLERGNETGGSKIALGTGLHRQYVYLAIPELIKIGLVEEIPHGKQNKYKARPPLEIEKIGRKRALIASDLARELNLVSNIGNEQDFEVIQGKKAIQQYEMEYVARSNGGDEELIIGGASSGFAAVMEGEIGEYLSEKQRKDVHVRYLGGKNEIEMYKKFIGVYPNQEYRFLPQLPEGVAHMVIRKDSVSFFTFLSPPLVYVVKSAQVAEHYKKFFLMLWEMAGEE